MAFSKKITFPLFLAMTLVNSVCLADSIARAYIMNQSEQDWKVTFIINQGHLNASSQCHENQECTIEKGKTKVIYYNIDNSNNYLMGTVFITDYQGNQKTYSLDYYHSWWYTDTPLLTAIDDKCNNDITINKEVSNKDVSDSIIIKNPVLCWPGHL